MTAESTDTIVAAVLSSRRYRNVAPGLVRRLVLEETPKARGAGELEKRVKRRLHQIFGAYAERMQYGEILERVRAASGDRDLLRDVCRAAMAGHASTRERLPIVEGFYREIFAVTGPGARILDIGCGLNPLAIPWMDLPPHCSYHAIDIDLELSAFLGATLPLLGVDGIAEVRDVVVSPPDASCDVALLLKALPCLEQQRAGIGLELLTAISARWIVVSYPTRSLGGHGKGMARAYRDAFERLAAALERPFTSLEFPTELVFVLPGAEAADPETRRLP